CWPHAYRTPAPTPTASRTPTTKETPKRTAIDFGRRGASGTTWSVTTTRPESATGVSMSVAVASVMPSLTALGRSVIGCSCRGGGGTETREGPRTLRHLTTTHRFGSRRDGSQHHAGHLPERHCIYRPSAVIGSPVRSI